ncbi:MAG: hypothetical protein DCF12_07800 [Snowella sp.]|jgi:hypothetical protein|nr:MAG: hypothetical protein DCF12_07800 [Snowella sp.]
MCILTARAAITKNRDPWGNEEVRLGEINTGLALLFLWAGISFELIPSSFLLIFNIFGGI